MSSTHPLVPWNRPPPWAGTRQEGPWALPDEWPLAFDQAAPWLGAAWADQPRRWRKTPCPSVFFEHPQAAHAWAVLGEFWRLAEALRVSGAPAATVKILSVPLMQSDFVWTLQLHGASPEGLRALGSAKPLGWVPLLRRPKADPSQPVDLAIAFPQEWLGFGTVLLEKTFAGGLPECPGGYAIEVDAKEPLADRLERWFGASYRSRWLQRQLQSALAPSPGPTARRPRF